MWLAERRQELLPGPYLQVVLTLPQELHERVRRHPTDLDDRWRRAAAHALSQRAMDPHDVGGLLGILGILHPWTRTLASHPHVHCLVPAGGGAADRTDWRPARTSYLVPVQALAQLLRGLLLDLVRQERPDLTRPEVVWTTGWVVDGKPAVHGTEKVLNDLGRDVHRLALTNPRLRSIDHGQGWFRYQDAQDQRWNTMTLPAHEGIRRFLPPGWPPGFHQVRYYGLWSPIHRPLLHQRQRWLAGHALSSAPESLEHERPPHTRLPPPLQAGQPGPHGGQGLLLVLRRLPRRRRGPP